MKRMNTNTHTPGPWELHENETWEVHPLDDEHGTFVIAEVPRDAQGDKEANARLIAASPRLLKALAGLAQYANGRLDRNPYSIPEFKEALQAIGEATGYKGDWMDVNVKAIAQ